MYTGIANIQSFYHYGSTSYHIVILYDHSDVPFRYNVSFRTSEEAEQCVTDQWPNLKLACDKTFEAAVSNRSMLPS